MAEETKTEVRFVHSKTRAEALASTDEGKIFFPTDATTIIKAGKEYGIVPVAVLNRISGLESRVTAIENGEISIPEDGGGEIAPPIDDEVLEMT